MSNRLFELQFSLYSLLFILLVHGGAIIILFVLVSLPLTIKLLLSTIPIISLVTRLWQQIFFLAPRAIVKFKPQGKNNWLLETKQGQACSAVLCGNSICTLYFMLLNFKAVGLKQNFSVVVLPDSLPSDNFRQLRLAIKASKTEG